MSLVVGIICEYNPFHKGHKYQIDKIRQEIPDATIISIMSGNIVQRGEFAIIDKYERARIALECGVNAVFELPYPYSGSTAEIFAKAGVELAYALGCDYLYFGVEEENIENLEKIARAIDSDEFERELNIALEDKTCGFIQAKERALNKLGFKLPINANDMLAVEYIRAINQGKIGLEYRCIKRVGSFYKDLSQSEFMSATAIREDFYKTRCFSSVPSEVADIYDKIVKEGKYLDIEKANDFIHMYCHMNKKSFKKSFDTNVEIRSIIKKSCNSKNGEEFISKLNSKIYTMARIKRSLLYFLFDIQDICPKPQYTVLLGADDCGRQIVNRIRKKGKICIITKHSDSKNLDSDGKNCLDVLYKVDELYSLLQSVPVYPEEAYKKRPIIE